MSKIQLSDIQVKNLAIRFKVLSEESRLKIIRALFEGEKSVNEIINDTGLLQANVSKQLKILESNRIVSCRPQGLQRFYSIIDLTVLNICTIMCNVNG
jgi:DNA-binding transcriptional ArsR family regulator